MIYLKVKAEQRLFLKVGLKRDILKMHFHFPCPMSTCFLSVGKKPTLFPQLFIRCQAF